MGPLVHYSVISQIKKLLKQLNIEIKLGTIFDIMAPDFGNHLDWKNQIISLCHTMHSNLIDKKDISDQVRLIAHFIIDYHAFTQSFSGYSKFSDFKFDIFSELVSNKSKYTPSIIPYCSLLSLERDITNSIFYMHASFGQQFKTMGNKFFLSSEFENFVRLSIKFSVEFTVAYVDYYFCEANMGGFKRPPL